MSDLSVPPELLAKLPFDLRVEIIENLGHKTFTPTEMVKIARCVEPYMKELAHERQQQGGSRGGQAAGKLPGATGDARDQVAAVVGTSPGTLKKATAVVEAAETNPEKYGDVRDQMDATGNVNGAYKTLQAEQAPNSAAAEDEPDLR